MAISWQALNRAYNGDISTMTCNCVIVLVFASFFIEANLNHIIEKMNIEVDMKNFLKNCHPGLQDKLGWFYNYCVDNSKAVDKWQLYRNGIKAKLRKKFPGFDRLYEFRNKIAHGIIDRSTANLQDAEILRKQAKAIVDELFNIATQAGHTIPRSISYEFAIASELSVDVDVPIISLNASS